MSLANELGVPIVAAEFSTIQLANQTKVNVLGSVSIWLIINSIVCLHTFLVLAASLDPIIIGMNFITQRGCDLYIIPRVNVNTVSPACLEGQAKITSLQVNSTDEKQDLAQSLQVSEFLKWELPLFDSIVYHSNVTEHVITMKHTRPLQQRYYPRKPAMQKIINDQIDELLAEKRIEPSKSPYSSPIVLVRKKNNEWRMCVDFRQINEHSIRDAYPINSVLEKLKNSKFFSTIDLRHGYWQIPMASESKLYTAFTVPGRGLFQWCVMPFGLHSASATFQRALDTVIGPELDSFAFAYLDDIVVLGKTLEDHLQNLKIIFERLRAANLRINKDKCSFAKKQIKYLGHVVSENGAVVALPTPTTPKELR